MLTEYYNNISTYLTQTFGANFIFFIFLLTTTASIAYFIMISYLITQLDTRYFLRKKIADNKIIIKKIADDKYNDPRHLRLMNNGASYVANIAKILIGVFLLLCGIAMLVLPGQGLLTILIGLSLIPFPGKHKLEQTILSRKSVRSSLNWIRTKAKKAPFVFD